MSEGFRSPTIYSPKTLNEFLAVRAKSPDSLIWAGGTWIMSRPKFYPNTEAKDIIFLGQIPELSRVNRSDRFIEAGSMVTLQQLLTMGNLVFSQEVFNAINSIGSFIIRNQATIGGALCTTDSRSFLSCILSTLDAQAEIRIISKHTASRWIPISKLYDRSGKFLYSQNALLSRVRIPTEQRPFQFFRTIDSPMQNPQSSVLFGLQFFINQASISNARLCLVFPSSGFLMNQELDNLLSTITLPVSPEKIMKISDRIVDDIPDATEIQVQRARRLIETVLYEITSKYLAG